MDRQAGKTGDTAWRKAEPPAGPSTAGTVTWSLSEFLNQFEFRSQSWCFAEFGRGYAFRIPATDLVYFYFIREGEVTLHITGSAPVRCKAGDFVFVLTGKSHLLSQSATSHRRSIPLLLEGEYVDSPPTVSVGPGPVEASVLSGRLKVRWPTARRLAGLPDLLAGPSAALNFDVARYVESADGDGAAAMLTHLANLIFVTAFRANAACTALFSNVSELNPVDRSRRYIELHPTHAWTVELLARKVGMSRSSFAAHFVAATGMTPMDMLSQERMRLAARLLETTDLKIAEISDRIGYRSEAAFHLRFKAHFAVRPGQYRRTKRGEHLA